MINNISIVVKWFENLFYGLHTKTDFPWRVVRIQMKSLDQPRRVDKGKKYFRMKIYTI